VAPPAAALEHVGEVIQPLLSQRAPARDDLAAGRLVSAMCHEPARKRKNGRRRALTNQLGILTAICCGKGDSCPALRRKPGIARGFACRKVKDPTGGTTGRVEPYGRLGWMGARA